jgi:FAD/FMN-containing dehydrogenase
MRARRLADPSKIEPTLQGSDIARLREIIRGELVLPDDPSYERARKVWNGMVDKRPAAVIYCAGADDVVAAVNFARSQNFLVSVRAGGHNVAGCSVCDGGIVIDVSRMKRSRSIPLAILRVRRPA